jgi:hypothetical protein
MLFVVARIECSDTQANRAETTANDRFLHFMGQLPLLPYAVLRRICRHDGRSYFDRTTDKPSEQWVQARRGCCTPEFPTDLRLLRVRSVELVPFATFPLYPHEPT